MAAYHTLQYGSSERQIVHLYPGQGSNNQHARSPLIIFVHGGAWRSGAVADHADLGQYISQQAGITVALIEYRLSMPGNKIAHPSHVQDTYDALALLFDEDTASRYRYDTSRSILSGQSIGGWLTLAASLDSDKDQERYSKAISDMPKLDPAIRKAIKAFIVVECIFSLVELIKMYPSYESFVLPALYPPGSEAQPPYDALTKAGPEAWPLGPANAYANNSGPRTYIIHSSEDSLLSTDYNAHGIRLLEGKGLKLDVDLTSFKGDHDDLLHTQPFWDRLVHILYDVTSISKP